ncbi:MAG: non-canonical purine NTP pyrophosphatase [Nitrospirae bacterium CG_4_9_14_3_um_filter_53_35]|nr:MAG: non-canonical purine NTP pyrophosphatase, RdgB/HAM1 family [Nitrospirae bacterium CG2_30_53_67]PIS36265.1 MAG: non-canonical purine NTP pyrophosphatase [Nitrospirae bacterium CG08_land_8_20_14_0_20_52_24]PIV85318.1 MAG: non-canonical purine NTP pyrophosphatase [Nitrospirae bacterium CG17_big_fil_post_rev_8_21_14_2_50_50_9]PIW85216.1 MAG: non-canonical purine NTP pyrophosphatase [Nitrospirae bacterium CG_4_8_14_3_um_filter_50_41]PIX85964.1 MAG: non-canonical purine NTP pyrophosphatase [N
MDVVIATRNRNKVEEISQMLQGSKFKVISLLDFKDRNLPEIQEDGLTFEENARNKALTIAKMTGRLTLADDSGLMVDALNGRPGVLSARYSGENATPEENNRKLLDEIKDVPTKKRTARFVCVVAIARPSGKVHVVEGRCEGLIAKEIRGETGFGYDPLFIVPEYDKTFAELGIAVKNRISHRAIAIQKAVEVLTGLSEHEKG